MQRDAAAAAAARACQLDELTNASRIAAFVALWGELDPAPIVAAARRRDTTVLLPVADTTRPGRALEFAVHEAGAPLPVSDYGIPEPTADAERVAPEDIDVVLVPLVAFDATGSRAGMGGGFYDRTFAFRLATSATPPPLLVGLAYHWQEVTHLTRASWDVPLDAVLTDRELRRFR